MTTRTQTTLCPACGATLSAHTDPMDPSRLPSPGDFSICLACAGLRVFDADLALRLPTPAETLEARGVAAVMAVQRAARALRSERGPATPEATH